MSQEIAIYSTIFGGVIAVIVAIIKFKPKGSKSYDSGVTETKITHIEEHLERLENDVKALLNTRTAHSIEIDGIKNIIEELKDVVNGLK